MCRGAGGKAVVWARSAQAPFLEPTPPPIDGDQNTTSAGRISDERPICRESQAPKTKVLLSNAAQPVTVRVRPRWRRSRWHCDQAIADVVASVAANGTLPAP